MGTMNGKKRNEKNKINEGQAPITAWSLNDVNSKLDYNQGVISLRVVENTMCAIFNDNLVDYVHIIKIPQTIGELETQY